MFVELQLSEALFARIVRNRIKSVPLCIDRDFPDTDGTPLAIDRIEIGDATSIQRETKIDLASGSFTPVPAETQSVSIFSPKNYYSVTVPYLQVRQEVSIRLVRLADLEQNGPAPSPVHKTLTIHPVFNVDVSIAHETVGESGPLSITYDLAYIDLGILAALLSAEQREEIERTVAGVRLAPTQLDFGALAGPLGRPVAAVNAGIACDADGSFIAMRVDFDVYETPATLDAAFFEAGPTNRLGGRDWAILVDADLITAEATRRVHAGLEGAPKVRLNAGPTASWNPGIAGVDIDADIELVDACPFFVDDIDLDVDLTVTTSLSVQAPNVLRTHHHIHGDPSDVGEEIACAVTAAVLWPFVGAILFERDQIDMLKYLGGLAAGPVPIFIAALVVLESQQLPGDISNQLGANCVKLGDEDYECNDPVDLVMELVPNRQSRLDVLAVGGVPEGLVLSGGVNNLPELSVGSLDEVGVKPFEWQILGRCTGNGTNNFGIGNQASISVGVTPPVDMCRVRVVEDPLREFAVAVDHVNNEITITPRFRPAYMETAEPYPCRVRIVTTRGVRTITLAPPQKLEGGEADALETARLRAVASCYVAEKFHTPKEELKWIPDPAPFELDHILQLWQVVAHGLSEGSLVRVTSPIEGEVLTARPSARGIAQMTMLFAGEDAPRNLSFELEGRGDAKVEFSMQQVLYGRQASLSAQGELVAMGFEGGARNRRLVIADQEREMAWRVSSAMPAPTLLSSLVRDQHELDGLVVHSGKRIRTESGGSLRRAVEALRGNGVEPELIASPRVGSVEEVVAVRVGGVSTLYDASGGKLEEMQTFTGRAWFEGTALGGDMLARHDPEAGAVHVYAAVARAFK